MGGVRVNCDTCSNLAGVLPLLMRALRLVEYMVDVGDETLTPDELFLVWGIVDELEAAARL